MRTGAERVGSERFEAQLLRQRHQQRLEADRHLLPVHRDGLGDRADHRLAHRRHLVGHVGVRALELPALEPGQVGENIVRIHRGGADGDVAREEQRQLLHVGEHRDVRVAGRQRVDRRAHVEEERLDRVRVRLADAGDDLLVDVARERVPVAPRRIAREQRGLLVRHLVADDAHPERRHLARHFRQVERASLGAVVAVGRGFHQTALPVEVAEQHVDAHPRQHAVEAVGVLGGAAVQVHDRLLAVARELAGDLDHVLRVEPGDRAPLLDRVLPGGLLEQLERGLNAHRLPAARRMDLCVHEQVAFHRALFVVRVERHRPAVLQYQEKLLLVFDRLRLVLGVRDAALLGPRVAEVRRAHELPGLPVLDLHQPRGVGPRGLAVGLRRSFIGAAQEPLVEAPVLEHPAEDSHRQRRVLAGLDGQPPVRLARELGKAGVHDRDARAPGYEILGHPHGAVRRAVVGLEQVGAHEQDVARVLGVRLPVELLPLAELAGHVLLADRLAGEVERALAHGRVPVQVGGAEGAAEALHEVAAPALDAAPAHDELVVLRPQVRVIRVDEEAEVEGVGGLESRDQLLLLLRILLIPDRLHVRRQGLRDVIVPKDPQGPQALDLARLLAGHVGEELPALHDLRDRLLERHALPAVLAAPPRALEHAADSVRVVHGLHRRLALRAQARVHARRVLQRGAHRQVREQRPRVVGVAVELDQHPVLDLGLHAAAGVAVHAHGVEQVPRIVEVAGNVGAAALEDGVLRRRGRLAR